MTGVWRVADVWPAVARWLALLATLALLPAGGVEAVELQPVVSGLSSPVYLTHAGDGSDRLFIVEQAGVIKVLSPGAPTPTMFLDITGLVLSGGERGLLGLAFHPQYATNGRFFVNYTRRDDGAIVVAEYARSAAPDVALPAGAVRLVIPHPGFDNHNGGMIAFGPDGLLYIGTGDGGGAFDPDGHGQNVDSLLGKMLRIDVDPGLPYTIPADNPFVGVGAGEIYAYGLRNPYRFSFDRALGHLLVGDVGEDAAEEIDRVRRGNNLGWPVFEANRCVNPQDLASCIVLGNPGNFFMATFPSVQYDHAGGRCSVIGGYVYRGRLRALPGGTYVFGDFCTGEIFTRASNGAAVVLLDTALAISSFGEDEAGELYVVDLGGAVYRLVASPQDDAAANLVSELYLGALGRAADPAGLAAWTAFLRASCSAAGFKALALGFFGAPEFQLRQFLSLDELVIVLYLTLLGREPEPAGLRAWADVLQQIRLAVARGFFTSPEFRSLLPDRTNRAAVAGVIRRLYVNLLRRQPDQAEVNAWVDFVVATGDLDATATGFLASPEFLAQPMSLGQYVFILYGAFLGRQPDSVGLAAWMGALQNTLLDIIQRSFLPVAAFNPATCAR